MAGRRKGRRDEEAAPLGSLSAPGQVHAPGTATCGVCGSDRLTRLHLALADGTDVTFVSCHQCEHRAWFPLDGDGTALERDEVVRRSSRS
ncbi:hypothetical protein [Cellulomonas triticagri]|uniref:TFIIS-type domain-containing protein n=1 Tax=Cellulomonas triticagri TaxID=2483352 RepID=A0A3M2IVI5_9CELL|nr:hypothetical protein [Cellulomonas triticagri]RMI03680.1 hypothetical protein EBM89_18770 [Cellulomonas triticagri]